MIKMLTKVNSRRTLFLGLSHENIRRLREGQPIVVDAQALLQATNTDGAIQDIVLLAGATEEAILDDLGKAMGRDLRTGQRSLREDSA